MKRKNIKIFIVTFKINISLNRLKIGINYNIIYQSNKITNYTYAKKLIIIAYNLFDNTFKLEKSYSLKEGPIL